MMKDEFESLLGEEVEKNEYDVIEYVYTWHPSISEVDGKRQIVELWKIGGMRLMTDMFPTASKAEELEKQLRKVQLEVEEIKGRMCMLRRGDRI